MSKFHINKHGVPAPCKAKEGSCPLGGESGGENHFDTQEEAQSYVDRVNEEEHSLLPGIEEATQADLVQQEMLRKLRDPVERAKLTEKNLEKVSIRKEHAISELKKADNPEDKRLAGYALEEIKREYEEVSERLEKQKLAISNNKQ